MSIELVARAKKTRLKGDSTAKLLLIVLADYANDEGMAWPSVRTLTEEVEKQDRQIQRALRKLEDMGLIRLGDQRLTRNYPKGQRPTVYEVLPAKPCRRGRETGDMHDTGTGDTHDTTTGVTEDTTTPVTHDTTPVTHMTPPRCHARRGTGVTHDTQTVMETTNKPSRESTRAKKPKSDIDRLKALAAFRPDDSHRRIADQDGLDLDLELEKFLDSCRAKGSIPADIPAAFRLWLRRGRELGITAQAKPKARHRHTFGCRHVLRLLRRDMADPDELSMRCAALLNEGRAESETLALLGLDPDELEEIA